MTLFLTISAYLIFVRWANQEIDLGHAVILSSLMAAAILSKYPAIFFAAALLAVWAKPIKTSFVILSASILTAAIANPQFWLSRGLSTVVESNTQLSFPPIPSVGVGSFALPDPLFYPWYFGEHFLLGYIGYRSLPFMTPFIIFALLTLRLVKGNKLPVSKEILWLGLTLTAAGLLPRMGILEYYYLPAVPGLALFAALLLVARNGSIEQSRGKLSYFSYFIVSLFVSVSPLGLVFSVIRPNFWNSLGTLILYFRLFPQSIVGIFGLIMSAVVIIWAMGYTLIVERRLASEREQ